MIIDIIIECLLILLRSQVVASDPAANRYLWGDVVQVNASRSKIQGITADETPHNPGSLLHARRLFSLLT